MENARIAEFFSRIADILDIQDENPFRVRSYRNAARIIADLSTSLSDLVRDGGDPTEFSGIGKSIAEKVAEIVGTGRLKFLEELEGQIPKGLTELLRLQGLGPKKVKLLYEGLGVDSVARLEKSARSGKLRELAGMGAKTEEKLLKSIEHYRRGVGRFKLSVGMSYAAELVAYLSKVKGVRTLEPAGSLRRRQETIGDLDILAICGAGCKVMDAFTEYEEVEEVIAKGETKSSVRLRSGMQVDVRMLAEGSFGAALHYFTGSKAHNLAIRGLAQQRGLKVSEYGVFRVKDEKRVAGKSEEEVFGALELPYIPPERRENRGEIEAAAEGKLPELLDLPDIRGDLQMHTTASDGRDSIERMAEKARELGYKYVAITDHSKAVRVAGGMDEKELAKHLKAIEKANAKVDGMEILKGVEVDILADGSLDLEDWVLAECDVVLASIHSRFSMPEEEMTERIIKGIGNENVNIFAHPTGRLVLERPAYQVNLKRLFEAARDMGVVMEINAYPDRLDLNDVNARMAKGMGLKIAINTDAHAATQLELMRFGVYTARRAWLEKNDVINTYPLKKFLKALR